MPQQRPRQLNPDVGTTVAPSVDDAGRGTKTSRWPLLDEMDGAIDGPLAQPDGSSVARVPPSVPPPQSKSLEPLAAGS